MKKRLLAILLCLCMAAALLPTTAFAAGTGAIQLGASGIGTDDKVYFGNYNNEPIYWRVTGADTDSLSLLSEYVLFDAQYDSAQLVADAPDLTYQTSELYTITLPNFKNNPDNFSALEAAQMSGLGLPAASAGAAKYRDGNDATYWLGKDFFAKDLGGQYYWDGYYVTRVYGFEGESIVFNSCGVRPAFNLNPASVLFTSATAGGKSASGMDSGLTAVGTNSTSDWKLTLKDSGRSSFTAATTAVNSNTLTVSYSGAKTGTNEYISAVIQDTEGNIKYYGRLKNTIADTNASGTVNITLPSGFDSATDTLYVFSEQYNDDYKTDYASALVEIELPSAIQLDIGSLAYGGRVYYGEYTDTSAEPSKSYDVPWYIIGSNGEVKKTLDANPTSLFLLSQYTLGSSEFRSELGYYAHDSSGVESPSELKTRMDGLYNGSGTTLFTASEQSAILLTTLAGSSMFPSDVPNVNAYLFPLSFGEANGIDTEWDSALQQAKSIDDPEESTGWWLRNTCTDGSIHCVSVDGNDVIMHVDSSLGVRPAFNLNLESVLFTSAAAGGKSASGMDGALTAVGTNSTNEWKLTLLDSSRSTFAAATTAVNDSTLTIAYSGATVYHAESAPNEYISAIVMDGNDSVSYYGRIAQPTAASGTVNITLPSGFDSAADTLYIFNEQYNGDYKTDYASDWVAVPTDAVNIYSITNTLTNISTSNAATYRLMSDTADYTATLTAEANYTLPASISVTVGGNPLAAGTDYEYDSASGSLTIFPSAITGNIVITAAGVRENTGGGGGGTTTYYTLRFDTNGGSEIGSISRAYGTTVNLSGYTTTREGYTFNGWYADEELTDRITSIRMTDSKTVYAGWTEFAVPVENPFDDVAADDYYYDAVLWAVTNGVTSGTADAAFAPDTSCTRAQVVTFLWRACGSPEPAAAESSFTDVRADAYYHRAVLWAVEQGITTGIGDATFSPDDTCTRAQIVTLLWRRMGSPVVNYAMDFADVNESAYYAEAVRWVVSEGITSGTREGFFSPNDTCTRAQAVTFLYRTFAET